VASLFDRLGESHRTLVLDFAGAPFVDSSGAHAIEGLVHKAERRGIAVYITGASAAVRRELILHGLKPPLVHYKATIAQAKETATRALAGAPQDQ
jgi:SulP family sulfate permease